MKNVRYMPSLSSLPHVRRRYGRTYQPHERVQERESGFRPRSKLGALTTISVWSPCAIVHYKMRIALGALKIESRLLLSLLRLGLYPPPRSISILKCVVAVLPLADAVRGRGQGEHLPIYLTKIYVSIHADGGWMGE